MGVFEGVTGKDEGGQAGVGDGDPQFFAQFADQTGLGRLALFDLAARKFPQSGQGLSRRPLADQHPSVDIDQGAGGDEKGSHFANLP